MNETARLWTGVLGPPLLWFAHLNIGYGLHAQTCASKSHAMLWIVTIIILALDAWIGRIALALWRAHPEPHLTGAAGAAEEDESRSKGRTRFLGPMGFAGACLFGLLVVSHAIPLVILRPCD